MVGGGWGDEGDVGKHAFERENSWRGDARC